MVDMLTKFNLYSVVLRLLLAVVIGGLIGKERAKHGRAAGMKTHILVCLGSALTALCGIYCVEIMKYNDDVMRIPAQVISGIGFLGAGMILVKKNSVIVGLTTAAGMWTTAAAGIAAGLGFYVGAVVVTAFVLITTMVLSKFEKSNKSNEIIYMEIDDILRTNGVIEELKTVLKGKCKCQIIPPKSGQNGNVGIEIYGEETFSEGAEQLVKIENVVICVEE